MKLCFTLMTLSLSLFALAGSSFATQVLAYTSGGGVSGYSNPALALGAPSRFATATVPDNSGVVSIGPSGSLILGFDRPIRNDIRNPRGMDFIVYGNALYVGGNIFVNFQEPARVEVGVDVNGNGLDATDPWYRLDGGGMAYGPAGVNHAALPTTWGCGDVTPTNGLGDPCFPDDPWRPGITSGTAGGDPMDLSWAVDSTGARVNLSQANFVRITSAGSWSPEVDAVAIVRPYRSAEAVAFLQSFSQ